MTTAWLLYYLRDDTAQYDTVWGTAAQTDPDVQFLGVR